MIDPEEVLLGLRSCPSRTARERICFRDWKLRGTVPSDQYIYICSNSTNFIVIKFCRSPFSAGEVITIYDFAGVVCCVLRMFFRVCFKWPLIVATESGRKRATASAVRCGQVAKNPALIALIQVDLHGLKAALWRYMT